MGGGFLALFGLGRKQKWRGGGEPPLAEASRRQQRRRRKGAAPEGADEFCRYSTRPKEAAAAAWQRSEEEGEAWGRWVAGADVDRRAKEFIDRVHYRRMHPDEWLEAI